VTEAWPSKLAGGNRGDALEMAGYAISIATP